MIPFRWSPIARIAFLAAHGARIRRSAMRRVIVTVIDQGRTLAEV